MELGDVIERSLQTVGVTDERISTWLGKPCDCDERKEKMNQLSIWAKRIAKGKLKNAKEFLTTIISDI